MAQNDLDLAALVSSRICHDLLSLIGAINNGLELLNMSGASPIGPEMQLICDSVKSASARIRFFRIAFGAASDDPVVRSGSQRGYIDPHGNV
jgi:histidine phosphotransferase ChpT